MANNGTMGQLQPDEVNTLNRLLLPVLNKAQSLVKLDPHEKKQNVKILGALLEHLCNQLKEMDPLFKLLYNRCLYSGSFYEDLRITSPNEFDINIVLVLSKATLQCELSCLHGNGAIIGCCVDEKQKNHRAVEELFSEFEGKYWLDITKVRRWFQSLLARAKGFGDIEGVYDVKYSESGPAKTLYIFTTSGRIDVDLVPAFEFPSKGWTKKLATDARMLQFMKKKQVDMENEKMCLVPKEHRTYHSPLYWRAHFPSVENKLMAAGGCLKPTIRLLKLFRDNLKWSQISSYALKTLVILCAMENPDDYWDAKRHGIIFYEMLERLRQALHGPGIPYIYCSKVDLLQNCKHIARENYACRLKVILRGIKSDPPSLMTYFVNEAAVSPSVENLRLAPESGTRVSSTGQDIPDICPAYNEHTSDDHCSREDAPLLRGSSAGQQDGEGWKCCKIL